MSQGESFQTETGKHFEINLKNENITYRNMQWLQGYFQHQMPKFEKKAANSMILGFTFGNYKNNKLKPK